MKTIKTYEQFVNEFYNPNLSDNGKKHIEKLRKLDKNIKSEYGRDAALNWYYDDRDKYGYFYGSNLGDDNIVPKNMVDSVKEEIEIWLLDNEGKFYDALENNDIESIKEIYDGVDHIIKQANK